MPYPRAHIVLLLLVPLIIVAFWPSYFSVLDSVSVAYHAHGITASLWIALLIFQAWAIRHRKLALHRAAGRSSFLLFPLFLAGALLVLRSMAQRSSVGEPFMDIFGAGLGWLDAVAVSTFAGLYFAALRNRGNVQLHARYMLATVLLLLSPVLARILPEIVPALAISGPEDFPLFAHSVQIANLCVVLVAAALYATAPRYGRPFLVVAAVVIVQAAGFQWLGPATWWGTVFHPLAAVPDVVMFGLGLAAGAVITWRGLRPGIGASPAPLPS